MKRVRYIVIIALILTGAVALGSFAFAQPDLGLNEFGAQTQLGAKPLGQIVAEIIRVFLGLLGMLAVILILYGGFVWMTAAGNPERITKAKKILINGLIGLVIILSAFAITQFVIGAIEKATGAKIAGPPGPPGDGVGLPADAFTIKGIQPQGSASIRNVVVYFFFNHNVEQSTVDGNILIMKKSKDKDGEDSFVSGDFKTTGAQVAFTPSAVCPALNQTIINQTIKCFDANTDYKVEIKTGLKDTGGKAIYCGAFSTVKCKAEFTTGSLVDTQAPTVSISFPDDGGYVCKNENVLVSIEAKDVDGGIAYVKLHADGAYVNSEYPPGDTPKKFNTQISWSTKSVLPNDRTFTAEAQDIDNHNAFSKPVKVTVKAEHCCNGEIDKDKGETGTDCGGVDCAKCVDDTCTKNSECATNSCVDGKCANTPMITGISPLSGAPGTYVSILGKYFGTTKGTIKFLGDATKDGDEKIAKLALCSNAWTDTSVVVVVPQGAASGPIEIETSIGKDATNDVRGPVIGDFKVDTTIRPGICELTPAKGKKSTNFTITGANFGKSQETSYIKFGSTYAVASSWGDTSITAIVPVLKAGVNSVIVNKNKIDSNALDFTILEETAGTKPTISYVNPEKGPPGEYITIYGSNFGDSAGTAQFLHNDGRTAAGDANFPAVCSKVDFWHNTSITVKVPAEFTNKTPTKNNTVFLRVLRADAVKSNSVSFNINSDAPKPGICGLKPNNGPVGTAVEVLGERFGTSGNVTFYNEQPATIKEGDWGNEKVKTTVPSKAVSGPVKLTTGGVDSNSVNFTVGDCSKTPTLCTENQQCCGSSCILKTETCIAKPKEGAYAWQISTGIILKAPRVIEECLTGEDVDNPSPSPWNSRPGGNSVCVNAAINVRFDSKLAIGGITGNNTIHFNTTNDTIALYECTETASDKAPCSKVSKLTIDSPSSGVRSVSNTSDEIALNPQNNFEKNTTYLVELTTGIRGAGVGGGYMKEKTECGSGIAYCFKFKTRNSDTLCEVGSVSVMPRLYTSNKTENLAYYATPKAKADVCIVLAPDAYEYDWESSQQGNALVIGGKTLDEDGNIESAATGSGITKKANTYKAVVETIFETTKDTPAVIKAEITTEKVSGKGKLTVKFTDPQVVSKWPFCNTACVNATIGAEFNIDMDKSTLIPANIEVLKCKTENCNVFEAPTGGIAGTIDYFDATKDKKAYFNFTPAPQLEISRYYLVRLNTKKIFSASKVALTGANDGKYYSWKFKTRADATPCVVNKITISPSDKELNYIGQIAQFDSEPFGAPDECSPQGQKLNPYTYDWVWLSSQASAVSLLKDGKYTILPLKGATCSNKCLNTGSKPRVSVCANGKKEKGEDCDDGNIKDGDGCSKNCLHEKTTKLTCGENIKSCTTSADCAPGQSCNVIDQCIDKGEDCDDGNKKSGDGCSDKCLNEGADKGGSICGNGDIGDGEDCDDGNGNSGDGCSSQCLNEGTKANISSCGNGGAPEKGEDCDDNGIEDGDGCSSVCLNEGSIAAGSTCGNGKIEFGEDCDDGQDPPKSGDGCSSVCLNEGSSLNYENPSICGNGGEPEKGEDCDLGTSDSKIDPRQYGKAEAKGKTEVSAAIGKVAGKSNVEVICIYTEDSQCPTGYGAGSDNCCYQKASITKRIPTGGAKGVCRNTLIGFTYDKVMDSSAGTVYIDEDATAEVYASGKCADGSAPKGGACEAAIKATRTVIQKETETEFNFNISSLLKAETVYQVRVKDFKSKKGVLASGGKWQFKTGKDICKLTKIKIDTPIVFNSIKEKIQVTTKTGLETQQNNPRDIKAQAISLSGGKEQEITSVKDYKWSWSWSTALDPKSVDLSNELGNPASVKAKAVNGDGALTATAKITEDTFNISGVGTAVSGSARLIVFICENPWPAVDGLLAPFKDPNPADPWKLNLPGFNFSTYYCRDKSPLLPALSFVSVSPPSSKEIIRESLFTDSKTGDAVGLRLYKNIYHLSPLAWYKAQKFVGSPQSKTVDGYNAVVDGRSIYINAANHVGENYTNIFVASYNQGGGQEIKNIYNQLLKNWKFNINLIEDGKNTKLCEDSVKKCSSDFDCGAGKRCQSDKEKIRRDTKRLEDLNKMAELLETYKKNKGVYPQLSAGTFLRGWSISTWPSWQATLGNELGGALPTDPLNKHSFCEIAKQCSISKKSCFEDVNCTGVTEECLPETKYCWNGALGEYQCTWGSHVYSYQHLPKDSSYQLATDFEFMDGWGWQATPEPLPDPNSLVDNFKVRQSCVYEVYGSSAKCGDGVVDVSKGEECEKGKTSSKVCSVGGKSGYVKLVCNTLTCKWKESGACQTGQCGDGVIQSPEECDDGQYNGGYGYCASNCKWEDYAKYCGDEKKNGPEQCDLGAKNGAWVKEGEGCSWDCKIPGPSCGDKIVQKQIQGNLEECDGNSQTTTKDHITGALCGKDSAGYQKYNTRTCKKDCTWDSWSTCKPKGSCGNSIKEGTEQCDDGNTTNTDSCIIDTAKNYTCKTAVCGDGYVQSGKEICDDGSKNGDGCTASYGLTCNYCSLSCNVITATGPYCGDGKKNGQEQCDGIDSGGKTCTDFNLNNKTTLSNSLKCTASCKIDTSDCLPKKK